MKRFIFAVPFVVLGLGFCFGSEWFLRSVDCRPEFAKYKINTTLRHQYCYSDEEKEAIKAEYKLEDKDFTNVYPDTTTVAIANAIKDEGKLCSRTDYTNEIAKRLAGYKTVEQRLEEVEKKVPAVSVSE